MRSYLSNALRHNRGFLAFLLLLGLFRTAVADWNPIPSGSMHPNLLEGDVVFVNRLAYDLKLPLEDRVLLPLGSPTRGDIATFSSSLDGVRLIKRIVALPGDRVEMRDKHLIINGQAAHYDAPQGTVQAIASDAPWSVELHTEQVGAAQRQIQWLHGARGRDDFDAVTVPPGQYLMLGDNRDNSADSRYIGFVPRELLIGRAVRVLVSLDYQGSWLPRLERFGETLN